jgi:cellulose biosynthesis protein BcsQ
MRTVAVAIKKGGSCKATTAVSVASCAAQEHGLRVLLIDLDSAGSATTWLGGISRVASAQVLAGDVSLAVAIERTPSGVHVCGGGPWLEAIEMRLVAEVGRELVLRDSLRDVSDRFDLTILAHRGSAHPQRARRR